MKFSDNCKGWLSVLAGFLIHLIIGNYYIIGILNVYLSSYFRYYGEPNLTPEKINLTFPIIGLTNIIFCPIGMWYIN